MRIALLACLLPFLAHAEVRTITADPMTDATHWQVGGDRINYTLGDSSLARSSEQVRPGSPRSLKLVCDFTEPRRGFVSAFQTGASIPGECRELRLWMWAAATSAQVVLQIEDARGRWFEKGLGPADWQGWRELVLPVGDDAGWQPLLRVGERRLPVLHPVNLRQIAIRRGPKSTGQETYYLSDLRATTDLVPADLVDGAVATGRQANLFDSGETAPLSVTLTNRGADPVAGRLSLTLTDFFGADERMPEADVTLAAGASAVHEFAYKTRRLGSYDVRATFRSGPRERVWFGHLSVTRPLPQQPPDARATFGTMANLDMFGAEGMPLVRRLNRDAGLRWTRVGAGWSEINPAREVWCWQPGTLVDGPVGKAVELRGAAYRVPPSPILDCPDEVTLAFFARGTASNGNWQVPIAKWGAANRRNYGVYFGRDNGDFCFSGSFAGSTAGWSDFDSGFSAWDGKWHHYAASYSRADKRVRLYVDGAPHGVAEFDGGALRLNADDLTLGQSYPGGLDEVAVFNRALTDAEVKTLATGAAPPQAGLVAWWSFDAAENIVDRSGHGLTLRAGEPSFLRVARDGLASGIKSLCILGFPADWASTAPKGAARPWVYKPDLAAWAKYVEEVVRRSRDVVEHFEIWNEPNIDVFWEPKPDAREYLDVLRVAYAAAKRGNPSCTVLMPALAGPGDGAWGMDFLDDLLRASAARYCDAISIHPYRTASPEASDLVGQLQHIEALAERNGGHRPIWFTEFGWTTQIPGGSTEERQALLLPRTDALALGTGLVDHLLIFRFHDPGVDRFYTEENVGLLYNDLTPKPAWHAHRTIAMLLDGAKPDGALDPGPRAMSRCFRVSGKRVAAVWCPDGDETVALRADKPVRCVDFMGNESTLTPEGGALVLRVGEATQFLRDLDEKTVGLGAILSATVPTVVRGRAATIAVTVANPFAAERLAEVSTLVPEASEVTPGSAEFRVPARGKREVTIKVTLPATVSPGFTGATLDCHLGSLHVKRDLIVGVRTASPDAGPVGLWHLDEGQGSTIHDASPSGNDGAFDRAEWIPGHKGAALRFDGTGSVTIPDAPSLSLSDEVTLAFWLRVDADTGTWQMPLTKFLADQRRNYGVYLAPGTLMPCFSGSFEKGTFRHGDLVSGVSLKPGGWHHIAATYSMFDRRLCLYVDGKAASDAVWDQGAMLSTAEPLRLGADTKGALDEVVIYPRALSPVEIAALARD